MDVRLKKLYSVIRNTNLIMEFEIDEEVDGNLIIIHGVENHPCLYNKHLKDYRNNLKRKRAWKEIAETYEKETGEKESGNYSSIVNHCFKIKIKFFKFHDVFNHMSM